MAHDNRYLIRQRQTWFAVVEVPPSVRPKLGKRRLKRTLSTRDLHVARARRFRVVADLKAEIEAVRRGAAPTTISDEALAWREALAAADAGEDVGSPPAGMDDGGAAVEGDSVGFIRDLIQDRYDALRSRNATREAAEGFAGVALGTATPLSLHVETWLSEGTRSGAGLKERTKAERRRAVAKLAAWMGRERIAATVEAVTRRMSGRYVSGVLIPSGRDPVTLGKTIRSLATYWSWLQRRGHLPEGQNPWAGQAPVKAARNGTGEGEERPFTDAEVARLLAGAASPTLAAFMRVAALTGLRREEIGKLTAGDCADGCFVVRAGKSAASRRRVPVHSALLGIVADRMSGKAPSAFLFGELRSKNAERTDPIGKLFTRYRRSLGIQDGTGRRSLVNFHSFRRWFITSAVNAGQPPHVVSLVVGHTEGRKGMTLGRYWGGADDATLRASVESVRLPDVAIDGAE